MSDPIWYSDYSIIFRQDRLSEFFPSKDQTTAEKVNALLRLSIYISILLCIYKNTISYMYVAIGAALFTYFIYKMQHNNLQTETSNNKYDATNGIEGLESDLNTCTRPTIDNPFMNVTMKDYLNIDKKGSIKNRTPACDSNNPTVKKELDNNFNHNLYKDVDDVFGKFNSQRQFYTMPSTTIPNRQDEFANWLYKSPKTCKEDSDFCYRYEDLRANRPVMVDPNVNPVTSKNL